MIIHNLEQGSLEWLKFKAGKVSGTSLKSAIGSKAVKETLLNRLIAERMTETVNDELNTEAVLRGKEMEPLAIKAVIKETGLDFCSLGMMAPDDIQQYAVSPDAVYYSKEGVIEGGLEVKCPNSKKHVEYLRAGAVPKEYFHQVLSPFLCDESVEWWCFASFDDRNYERPLFMKMVFRKDLLKEIEKATTDLVAFLNVVDEEYYNLTF